MHDLRTRVIARFAVILVLQAVAAGTVPAQQVLEASEGATRIEILLDETNAAREAMAARLDYFPAPTTLAAAMHRKGASPDAIEHYAKDWGQGYLYLTWDAVLPFYGVHSEALETSLRQVQAGATVVAADIDYLERGMDAWRQIQTEISDRFDEFIDTLAERGVYLGRALELNDRKFAETQCCGPEWEAFSAKAAAEQARAEDFSQQSSAMSAAIRDYGGKRLFSAIDAAPRVAVTDTQAPQTTAEADEEECEESPELSGDFEVLEDIQAGYDASESASQSFLERAEQEHKAIWPGLFTAGEPAQ
jgi:hypothetical protein